MTAGKTGGSPVLSKLSALGMLVTLGIVFGDIGTSPLYVMKTIMHVNPAYDVDYIIGAVSCVIWTLTFQTTFKYVLVALRADNKGEGGILALYALVRKHKRKWLYVVAIIGAATLFADGVITPSITVTSAIEGLQGLNPDIPVVPITIAIISMIFFVQRFGTSRIGRSFGPFMLFWFLMLGVLGALHVSEYPMIVKAFNPYYAAKLLATNPSWFLILGAVFLCTTGAEALYSDLGHCGRKNIEVCWIYVKTMLILNYMGQGAWIISNMGTIPGSVNPFYGIMPHGMLFFGVLMATGAAIIASQALISGCFTIVSEAMNLSFSPRLRIKYPTNVRGQLFVPKVNLMLYVLCIATVVLFQTSGRMEAAYGLSITLAMISTTLLLAFYLRSVGVAKIWVGAFFVFYVLIEGGFLAANLSKFLHGGWFTVLIAGLLFGIMYVWYNAHRIRRSCLRFRRLSDYYEIISDLKQDASVPKYASNLVYINHSDDKDMVEDRLIYSIINKQPKRADHYFLFHFEIDDEPGTLEYSVRQLVPGTLYAVDVRTGFRVNPQMSVYLRQVVEDLVEEGALDLTSGYPSLRSRGIAGDFRFVVIRRVYNPDLEHGRLNTVMSLYNRIKRAGLSEERALGLDTSSVTVETVPLILHRDPSQRIRRVES